MDQGNPEEMVQYEAHVHDGAGDGANAGATWGDVKLVIARNAEDAMAFIRYRESLPQDQFIYRYAADNAYFMHATPPTYGVVALEGWEEAWLDQSREAIRFLCDSVEAMRRDLRA